jgi:hypothetical protein
MRSSHAILLLLAVGCGDKKPGGAPAAEDGPPILTPALLPAAAAGFMLQQATEADILARFPAAKVETTNFNGEDADELRVDGGARFTVFPRGAAGKLRIIHAHTDGVCDWVQATIAPLPRSTRCPGNRKTGLSGGSMYYCMRLADGTRVTVECDRDMKSALRDDGTEPPPADSLDLYAWPN